MAKDAKDANYKVKADYESFSKLSSRSSFADLYEGGVGEGKPPTVVKFGRVSRARQGRRVLGRCPFGPRKQGSRGVCLCAVLGRLGRQMAGFWARWKPFVLRRFMKNARASMHPA